jgi:hypothetical protein
MKTIFMLFVGLVVCIVQSASAQTTPTSTTSLSSMDSLLQAGYEIKAIDYIPVAQTKEIFGANVADTTITLVTLQKGASVAVCTIDSAGWATLADASMTDPNACNKR